MEIDDGTTLSAPTLAGEEFRGDTNGLKQPPAGNVRKLLPPDELLELTTLAERVSAPPATQRG